MLRLLKYELQKLLGMRFLSVLLLLLFLASLGLTFYNAKPMKVEDPALYSKTLQEFCTLYNEDPATFERMTKGEWICIE